MSEENVAIKEAIKLKAAVCKNCPTQNGVSATLGHCLKPSAHHVRVRIICNACNSSLVKPVEGIPSYVDCHRYKRWLDRHDRDITGKFCSLSGSGI